MVGHIDYGRHSDDSRWGFGEARRHLPLNHPDTREEQLAIANQLASPEVFTLWMDPTVAQSFSKKSQTWNPIAMAEKVESETFQKFSTIGETSKKVVKEL